MKFPSNTLQNRLFVTFSLIICLIMFICFVIFDSIFMVYSNENVSNNQINLCSSIADSIDSEVEKMNTVSMNIIYSNLITRNFRDYLEGVDMDLTGFPKAKTAQTIFDVIWAVIGPFQTVSQVNIYSLDGDMIGSGLFNLETKVNLDEKSWYAKTRALEGSKYISRPDRMQFIDEKYKALKNNKFFSLCRMFVSDRFVVQGIVEVLQDQESVFDHTGLIKRQNGNVSIYVLNGEGELIYPDSPGSDVDGAYYSALITSGALEPMKVVLLDGSGTKKKFVTTYLHSEYTNWDIIVSEPAASVYEPVYRVNFLLFASSIALIFLGWLISWITARHLVVPLTGLQKALAKIDASFLSDPEPIPPPVERHPIREIEALNYSFRLMQEKLHQSTASLLSARSEETKAKMLALQSLMNPHFVYNNLATISSMAEDGQMNEIVSVCADISAMLRYISADGAAGVPLGEEIAHTERFLNCMKVRFGHDLTFLVDVPDSMRGIVIPKLMVQPVVENAIKHGFNIEPPWRVVVTGYVEDGAWRIVVEDNGIGFNPESLSVLRERIRESQTNGMVLPYGIEGIGLLNIYLRMKICFGESCFFEVGEGLFGGARVTIGGALHDSGNV